MKKILYIMLLNISIFAVDASMEITKKSISKTPLSFIIRHDDGTMVLASNIEKLVKKDLEVTGYFEIATDTQKTALASIELYIHKSEAGSVLCDLELTNVASKKSILAKQYTFSDDEKYPFLAHKITIDVNNALGASSVEWMSNMLLLVEYKKRNQTVISIADYTLTYKKGLIKGGVNLFAKWANGQRSEFYFTNLDGRMPALYRFNIFTGKTTKIYESSGMIVCSDVGIDENKILVTMSPNDQPDIYMLNTKDKTLLRLTDYAGIDVNGRFVDNDSKIVFLSDRLKQTSVFIKEVSSDKNVTKFVDTGSANNSIATANNRVAFVSREADMANRFNIYLTSTKSLTMQKITNSGKNQFPRFSKDGENLLFVKEEGGRGYVGLVRLLQNNQTHLFSVENNKLQSIDW